MRKLFAISAAGLVFLFAGQAFAWVDLPGNPVWTLDENWSSYPPKICQATGGDFGWWHLVDDASLGNVANCVKVNITGQLVLNPINASTGTNFGPLGHGALVLSNATEAGGTTNFPSGSTFLRFTFHENHRVGADVSNVGFPVWKFSVTGGGSSPLLTSYYSFVPTAQGWSLNKMMDNVTTTLASGLMPKYVPLRQHSVAIYQNYSPVGADIKIYTGGAIVADRISGLVKVIEVIDPNPLTIGRFGFGAVNATIAFGEVTGQQF